MVISFLHILDVCRSRRMDEGGVELLWMKTRDLAENPGHAAARHAVLELYSEMVAGQYECLDVMRAYLFRVVEGRAKVVEDLGPAIGLLDPLTSEFSKMLAKSVMSLTLHY